MDKQSLKSGMLLRISAGTGTYHAKKWAAIIRVISVTKHGELVKGMQYIIIAQRGEKHDTDFLLYEPGKQIVPVFREFSDWWETFKPKLLA